MQARRQLATKLKRLTNWAGAALLATLAACGGGGSSDPAPSPVDPTPVPNGPSTFVAWAPSASVLAAKRGDSALRFVGSGTGLSPSDGCWQPLTNTTVYEQAHTVVFAAEGVTEADQQEVADYAEAAVLKVRNLFPISSGVGLNANQKVQICVQTQFPFNSLGVALISRGPDDSGIVVMPSPSRFYAVNPRPNPAWSYFDQSFQAFYKGILAHEMTHVVEKLTFGYWSFELEQWLTEGMADFVGHGVSRYKLSDLITIFAMQNPISVAWPTSDPRPGVSTGNDIPGVVVNYLMSPTGANNSLSTFVAMLERIRADSTPYVKACYSTGLGTPECSSAAFEARRSATFVAAFEATFKERDGTPMKLRAGANNLQDTIVSRLSAWWP